MRCESRKRFESARCSALGITCHDAVIVSECECVAAGLVRKMCILPLPAHKVCALCASRDAQDHCIARNQQRDDM